MATHTKGEARFDRADWIGLALFLSPVIVTTVHAVAEAL